MTQHRPAFTRNGLAWLLVGSYVCGWLSHGFGFFAIKMAVVTTDGQAAVADITIPFLMSILPFVTWILQFYFRKGISPETAKAETPS